MSIWTAKIGTGGSATCPSATTSTSLFFSSVSTFIHLFNSASGTHILSFYGSTLSGSSPRLVEPHSITPSPLLDTQRPPLIREPRAVRHPSQQILAFWLSPSLAFGILEPLILLGLSFHLADLYVPMLCYSPFFKLLQLIPSGHSFQPWLHYTRLQVVILGNVFFY